ncbi:MAG: AEC family transporter, partial [Rhodospirillales bacterium]|nr:AEC family transporter [Rhodospirillales bacterium]
FAASKVAGFDNPVITSVIQGGARHNAFIAIAIIERLYGGDGLTLALLASAALIPTTNLMVVSTMSIMLQDNREGSLFLNLVKDLSRNPLLLSVGLGIAFNLLGVGKIPVIHDMTQLLGQAALPIVLLCVGANLRIKVMKMSALPFIISAVGKFLFFPAGVFVVLTAFNITGEAWAVAMIYSMVPTASAGYTLARQMGGDAPLMASIVTLHTLFGMLLMPVVIALWILP